MLILTRRVGEPLFIGDSITVTVLGMTRHDVRIGIDAPAHVPVHRDEIWRRIQAASGRNVPQDEAGDVLLATDSTR